MSNANDMGNMEAEFREMQEEIELQRQQDAEIAEQEMQQEAQEFEAYKQGLVEEFKASANDGAPDAAQNELEASAEQNQTAAPVEPVAPQVEEAELKESQQSNDPADTLNFLTDRVEERLEKKLDGADFDVNDPAQMAMLASISEDVAKQMFTNSSENLIAGVALAIKGQVVGNANDAAELAAAAPAPAPVESQGQYTTITGADIVNEVAAKVAEEMNVSGANEWDAQRVMETASDIGNYDSPDKAAFQAAVVHAYESSSFGDLTQNMNENHLENSAVKDLNNKIQMNGMLDTPEVGQAAMQAPAATVNSGMSL